MQGLPEKDTFYILRFGLVIMASVAGIALACWVLTSGGNYYGASGALATWVAYAILVASVFWLLVSLFWYWAWFAQKVGMGAWYLAGIPLLIGLALCPAGYWFHAESVALTGLGLVLLPLSGLLFYGAWRLVRLMIVRLFHVLLIAVSQTGAAWRGEVHPRSNTRIDS
jgi:hypothetical protein